MTSIAKSRDGKRDADALDRELDEAREGTFPASDPIAVDTAETHEERHKDREQKRSDAPRSGVREDWRESSARGPEIGRLPLIKTRGD